MSLFEVLIALAIVSVALTAGLRALGLSASGSQAMHERSLALLAVAQGKGFIAEEFKGAPVKLSRTPASYRHAPLAEGDSFE